MNKIGVLEVTNKLGCYSVQLDSSWVSWWWLGWGGGGVTFLSRNNFVMPSLSCVPSFNFLLCLQQVKKFVVVVVVVWWCGGGGGGGLSLF